ncbi:hypothetical protein PSPO01_00772 [Paraphaeosphaeria sporulosa]
MQFSEAVHTLPPRYIQPPFAGSQREHSSLPRCAAGVPADLHSLPSLAGHQLETIPAEKGRATKAHHCFNDPAGFGHASQCITSLRRSSDCRMRCTTPKQENMEQEDGIDE